MRALVAAELLKLRTTRTTVVFILVGLGLLGLSLAVVLLTYDETGVVISVEEHVRAVLTEAGLAAALILLLAVVNTTGEHRHETISATLIVAPDRRRVVVAKAAAYALAGAALGLLFAGLTAAVALPVIAAKPSGLFLSGGEIALVFLGVVLGSGITGALGVGFGALFRSQVIAVIAAVAIFTFVEPLLGAFVEEVALYGPSGALAALAGEPPLERPPMLLGGVLSAAYAGALITAGAVVLHRRDIT